MKVTDINNVCRSLVTDSKYSGDKTLQRKHLMLELYLDKFDKIDTMGENGNRLSDESYSK